MNIHAQSLPENLPELFPEIIKTNIFLFKIEKLNSFNNFNKNGHLNQNL